MEGRREEGEERTGGEGKEGWMGEGTERERGRGRERYVHRLYIWENWCGRQLRTDRAGRHPESESSAYHGSTTVSHVVLVVVAVRAEVHTAGDARERSLLTVSQPALIPCLLRGHL